MSMSPITETVQGQSLTFMLPKASLDAVLTYDELGRAFQRQAFAYGEAHVANMSASSSGTYVHATQAMWAAMLAAGTNAAMTQIPDDQVRSIIREALIGGGMASGLAVDTADRICRGQLNRAVDYLAAQIVQAAIAAG
jgi:hypothetical protein